MSDIDVDLTVLGTIAENLGTAGTTLAEIDTDGSTGVEAGLMTAVITSMIGQISDSAGNVADALTGLGELVESSRRYYRRADADAQASLEQISVAMEE